MITRHVGRIAVAASLAVLVSACGSTDAQDSDVGGDGQRFLEPVFDEVDVTSDVEYREAADYEDGPITLELDIYEPAGDTAEERPVALLLFPGGFYTGDKTDVASWAEDIAQRGYVAVAIDYRLRDNGMDEGGYPEAVLDAYDDAAAAVAWLQEHADEYHLDPEVVSAVGFSSGAVVAWNLAWLPTSPGSPRPEPVGVSAAVSVAGAPGFVSEAAPGGAPVLAFAGELDTTVLLDWPRDACVAAGEVGGRCDLIVYDGAEHSIGSTHQEEITPCLLQFVAKTVLVDADYVPADAVGPTCTASSD